MCYDWKKFNFREYLRPRKCYKCNRFGHISTKCDGEECCPLCGETDHKRAECTKEAKCVNCTHANVKFNKSLETNHTSLDPTCPTHLNQMKLLKNGINYV